MSSWGRFISDKTILESLQDDCEWLYNFALVQMNSRLPIILPIESNVQIFHG